jgi:hypothetical protein
MAVTEEFKQQVAEALDELGYSVENENDVIDNVDDIDDDVTLPGVRQQNGIPSGYVSMKLAVIKAYLNRALATFQTSWNALVGTVNTAIGNANDATSAANTAAGAANTAAGAADDSADAAVAAATLAYNKAALADDKADYAQAQGDYAKELADHPPYIADGTQAKPGDVNYWYVWSHTSQQYVKNAYARGSDLDYSEMTEAEKNDLAGRVSEVNFNAQTGNLTKTKNGQTSNIVPIYTKAQIDGKLAIYYNPATKGMVFPADTSRVEYDSNTKGMVFH